LPRFHARPVGSPLVIDRAGLIRSLRAIRRGRPANAAARRVGVATELRRERLGSLREGAEDGLLPEFPPQGKASRGNRIGSPVAATR
jgi:hypothetical protein